MHFLEVFKSEFDTVNSNVKLFIKGRKTNLLCIVSFSTVDSNAFMNVPEVGKSFFVSRSHGWWDIFQHNFLVFGCLHFHLEQRVRKFNQIFK